MNIRILGAGLMGQVMALTLLQRKEFHITLSDDGQSSAALSAAGMIAPFTELDRADYRIAELGQQSLVLWPDLLKRLDDKIYFRQQGALVCAHPRDQAELSRYQRSINKHGQSIDYQVLSAGSIMALESELQSVSEAYYFPQEGQIDCQKFLSLAQEFLADQVSVVNVDQSDNVDYVIDCRGLGGKAVFNDLRGVRGEVIWLQTESVKLTRPVRLLHPRYSIYIVPRPDNIYIVGASEIEAEDKSAVSVRSMMELLSAACSVHQGFMEARIIQYGKRLSSLFD